MWIKRMMHVVAYTIGLFMIGTTWLSELPVYEQIFRTGIVLYLSIIYIEFVDGSMLGNVKLSVLFEGRKVAEEKSAIENLMQASNQSIYWIRMVQQSETPQEREVYTQKLTEHIQHIEELDVPKKYKKDQRDILREVKGFYVTKAKPDVATD